MQPPISAPNRQRAVDISATDHVLARGVVVIEVLGAVGDVVLRDAAGTEVTFTSDYVTARGRLLVGEWEAVVKTGTAATGLIERWRTFVP
jgi:hypothetical protein